MTHYTRGTPSPLRAPTVCKHPVSGTISLPSSGCFSPFPHGTCSLSVAEEYLGLEGGPPTFRQDFTCPALLEDQNAFYRYGAITHYGRAFQLVPVLTSGHWPGPRSLATTNGVSVDVLSSGYLDVSVPRVSSLSGDLTVGFPHSEIHGSKLIRSSPQLIAAYHVFHRLSAPRHPLNALKALDRSHYRCPQLDFRSCSAVRPRTERLPDP